MCEIARSQAALMATFAKFRRLRRLNFANFAMRAAWLRLVPTQLPLGTITKTKSTAVLLANTVVSEAGVLRCCGLMEKKRSSSVSNESLPP